jgi:hypothetical protein
MHAGSAKSLDATVKLDHSQEARKRTSNVARKTVILEAHKEYVKNKPVFEGLYGRFQEFSERILEEKQNLTTWPEFCQWAFYANANPQLEFRIKQRVVVDGAPRTQTYSTKKEGAPQPEFVIYPVFRTNHYDLVGIEKGGVTTYVFTAAQAAAAEKLIDAHVKDSGQGKGLAKGLAKDLDQQELSQLLDGALGLTEDAQDEEAFATVESRNSKKRRKKAEGEKKAAAAAKKAAAKAGAEAEARVTKAAVKAATDLLRQNGGSAWAQPPPWEQPSQHRQGKGIWGHHPGSGPGPGPPAQRAHKGNHTGHTPAVVVFGNGSKKSLRRAIKEMDPAVETAIKAVYKIEAGVPRAVLYCTETDLEMVLDSLPTLRAGGIGCAAYKEQRGGGSGRKDHDVAPPKAKQAERGLLDASRRAGVCHYMTSGRECPHSLRGQCKFTCYDQQRSAQRRQPSDQQHSAQRRQPSGWRR